MSRVFKSGRSGESVICTPWSHVALVPGRLANTFARPTETGRSYATSSGNHAATAVAVDALSMNWTNQNDSKYHRSGCPGSRGYGVVYQITGAKLAIWTSINTSNMAV